MDDRGTKTNDTKAFLRTTFLLIAPTAPKENAPAEEHKKHLRSLQEQARLFSLKSRAARRDLVEMSRVRRDILAGQGEDLSLVQTYKRRSESKVNDENKEMIKRWIEEECTKVTPSPNQRDTVVLKDENGEEVGRERVYLYEKSKGQLYHEFIKSPNEGGSPMARDEDGLIVVGRSTFEKLLPAKTLKRMNETHKQICACRECQNTEWMHEAMKKYREDRLAVFRQLHWGNGEGQQPSGAYSLSSVFQCVLRICFHREWTTQMGNGKRCVPFNDMPASWRCDLDGSVCVHTWTLQ